MFQSFGEAGSLLINIVASQKCGFKEEIYRWRALLRSTHKCFFNSNQNMGSSDNRCGVWSGMGGKQSFYYKALKTCSSHFAFKTDITSSTDRSRFCGSSSTKFGHVVHFGVFSHVFDTRQIASRGSAGSCERPGPFFHVVNKVVVGLSVTGVLCLPPIPLFTKNLPWIVYGITPLVSLPPSR